MKLTSCAALAAVMCLSASMIIAGCGGSSSSGSSTPTPQTPTPPTISSVSPSTVAAGAASTTLTVTGSGFISTTTIQVNGAVEVTTFVSSTQVTAIVPASQLTTGARLSVIAINGTLTSASGAPVNLEVDNPTPTITQFVPATFAPGAAPSTVSVTGTGFVPATVMQVNGSARATTYVSATQVNVILTVADLATAGSVALTAVNPAPGGGSSAAASIAINNPAPGAITVSPSATIAGTGTATTITVTGTNFVPASSVQIGGTTRATTYVSGTQLTFALTVADQAAAGFLSVTVVNPTPGGGSTAPVSIAVNNPVPGTIAISPTTVTMGTATATTITVTGTNFVSTSSVQIGGMARATSVVSATQLTFLLTVADQAVSGPLTVTVVNPAPGGGTSTVATITVAPPVPTPVISTVYPAQFFSGSGDTTISVNGLNFAPTSIVQWNGTPLVTTYGTNYYPGYFLSAVVPASLLTTAGTENVTVNSPTATPPLSNAFSVTITDPPAPTLTSISPIAGPIQTDTVVTLNGTGFTASTTVSFNGTTLTPTYSNTNPNQLTVTIPAASLSLPGNDNITVTTPAPGGGTTAPLLFTAYIGIANNSMVYNPANGLFYVSVPGSAGEPYGNSVVSVDPATGALGTPVFVGSEPNKLAITSDGHFLWVGLDSASAVRKVDLTTNTAGLQFSLGGNAGIYATPATALALAALPGAPDSVVVSTTANFTGSQMLSIYDSGVARGNPPSVPGYFNGANALQVDGSLTEIYAGSQSGYSVYTYGPAGLTLKTTTNSGAYANNSADEMQVAGGRLYTDFGTVYDAESGSLLGTFYRSPNAVAYGPSVADTTLGKVFIVDSNFQSNTTTQILSFNTSDFNAATTSTIPVNVTTLPYYDATNPSRLTRWGTNGLAFRNGAGVYSLRSNLVKDLSTVSSDLGVTITTSGPNTTGANTTFTATINNAGPSAATNIALTALLPSSGVLVSATPSAGTCSTSSVVTCDLGGLANGASTTVAFVVSQLTAGNSALTVQVSGSETDPNLANNQATSTATLAGSTYTPVPALLSVSPAAILAESTDTVVTVTGSGFSSASSIVLDGVPLATTATSGTQLTATVPAAKLVSLGWSTISVTNPAPGGGSSNALPLSIYSVVAVSANRILYDPFSTNILASVASTSTTTTGNSIVFITPNTGTIGTPANIGSQPTRMALSDDGQVLYTILAGAQSVARFNMLTQQGTGILYTAPANNNYGTLRDLAVQPGSEDTIALDFGYNSGLGLIDFNPANSTASLRGTITNSVTGTSPQFLDSSTLLVFNIDTWRTLDRYPITSSGLTPINWPTASSTLDGFSAFKLSNGIAYANNGGVADPSIQPATQIGVFPVSNSNYQTGQIVAPDASLGRAFFLASSSNPYSSNNVDGVAAYDEKTFLLSATASLNMAAIEGNTSFNVLDLIRWGQDGLAVLTDGGRIYLLRGPVVVPQLLNQNAAATLTASSASTLAHGSGNATLTLTGSNFVPGVAVTWNGSYRTTTIVDATHLAVAIPASDLASAGSASLIATNPSAPASSALTITVN